MSTVAEPCWIKIQSTSRRNYGTNDDQSSPAHFRSSNLFAKPLFRRLWHLSATQVFLGWQTRLRLRRRPQTLLRRSSRTPSGVCGQTCLLRRTAALINTSPIATHHHNNATRNYLPQTEKDTRCVCVSVCVCVCVCSRAGPNLGSHSRISATCDDTSECEHCDLISFDVLYRW